MDTKPQVKTNGVIRRLGLLDYRVLSHREHNVEVMSNPFSGSLARCLHAGYATAVDTDGQFMLQHEEQPEKMFRLDEKRETFVQVSSDECKVARLCEWGCVTPIFDNIVAMDEDPVLFSAAVMADGELSFEGIRQDYLEENRVILRSSFVTGFEEDADDSFNMTLSKPLSVGELTTTDAFSEIFPDDDDDEPIDNGFKKSSEGDNVKYDIDNNKTIGRIIISYRHQRFGKDRFTFDDWLCGEHIVRNVMKIYKWQKARFWTDARLRKFKRLQRRGGGQASERLPWAEIGIAPYKFGPVVVLSCSEKPSVVDRFWLTIERLTGAHFFGTWLVNDAGDLFYFRLGPDYDYNQYFLAIVTSVSSSQQLSWPQDRDDLLHAYWKDLYVENVQEAIEELKLADTFESKHDFIGEELYEFEVAPRGRTIQWSGDVEALIDPPCLMQVFGSVGELTFKYPLVAMDLGIIVGEVKSILVVFEVEVQFNEEDDKEGESNFGRLNSYTTWIAKRVYTDIETGEIRARSVPRLVDEDFSGNCLALDKVTELPVIHCVPQWPRQTSEV